MYNVFIIVIVTVTLVIVYIGEESTKKCNDKQTRDTIACFYIEAHKNAITIKSLCFVLFFFLESFLMIICIHTFFPPLIEAILVFCLLTSVFCFFFFIVFIDYRILTHGQLYIIWKHSQVVYLIRMTK